MTQPARLAPRVVIVGGGISGTTAAYRLRTLLGPAAELIVVEATGRLGGALHTATLAGAPYDVGAEAFLYRRPEMPALIGELGLADEVVHPTTAAASVRAGGHTGPLPAGTLMGLPRSVAALSAVLSADGLARAAAEPAGPIGWRPGGDESVGSLVRRRLGDEVADRLVDPLLGGVYAGRADGLGVRATVPALATVLDRAPRTPSLTEAVTLATGGPGGAAGAGGPVFGVLRGGTSRLVDALVAASGARLRLGAPVRGLSRVDGPGRVNGPGGVWRVELGSANSPEYLSADAVLLAVPAPVAARLLAGIAPAAADAAAGIELASSVVVGLALPADRVEPVLPRSSGVLVASGEPLTAKAFTFSSRKWAHVRGPDVLLVRGSVGRFGQAALLRRDDDELVAAVRADLAALTGVDATPVDTVVRRWGGGLPQYGVGHLDRVAALEAAVAAVPGLALAGAALHGVGVPACVATATSAAARLAGQLTDPQAGPLSERLTASR